MNKTLTGLALAALVGSLTMTHAQEATSADAIAMRAGVIGSWKLDKNLSDAQDRAGGGRRSGPPGGGGNMGGGGGMPPGGMGALLAHHVFIRNSPM